MSYDSDACIHMNCGLTLPNSKEVYWNFDYVSHLQIEVQLRVGVHVASSTADKGSLRD